MKKLNIFNLLTLPHFKLTATIIFTRDQREKVMKPTENFNLDDANVEI